MIKEIGMSMDKATMVGLFNKWAVDFLKEPQVEMSMDLSNMFINSLMKENAGEQFPPAVYDSFSMKMITSRAKYLGLDINDYAAAFLGVLTESPGEAVMYLSALKYRYGASQVTVNNMAFVFALGFPSKESLHKMWDAQKISGVYGMNAGTDNLLDLISAKDFNGQGQDSGAVATA